MGYRSDVHAIIYWPSENTPVDRMIADGTDGEKYNLSKTLLHTTFKDLLEFWDKYEPGFSFHDDAKFVEFQVSNIKWYDDFPEVVAFEEMLDAVQDLGFAVEFIEIGEDDNDTTIRRTSNSQYRLILSRVTEVI